jgi:hypothetical protein
MICGQLMAQDFTYRHYSVPDGLPQTQVWDIFQDSKGYMWIATKGGLARFDGMEFTIFRKKDGLNDDYVYEVTELPNGELFIKTQRGLNKYDHRKFTSIYWSEDEIIPNARSRSIHFENDSSYTILNDQLYKIIRDHLFGPLFDSLKFTRIIPYDKEGFLLNSTGFGIFKLDVAGVLSFFRNLHELESLYAYGQDLLLYDFRDQILYRLDSPSKIPLLKVYKDSLQILQTVNYPFGHLKIDNQILLEFNGSRVTRIKPQGIIFNCVFTDDKKNLWMSSQQGLYLRISKAFQTYPDPERIFYNIYNIVKSGEETWMFSFYNRILKINGPYFEDISFKSDGFPGIKFYSAQATDFSGNPIIGTNQGLLLLKDKRLIPVYPEITGTIVYATNDSVNQRILLAGYETGFNILERDGKVIKFPDRDPLYHTGTIQTILVDKFHRYWVGGKHGISLIEKDSIWTDLPTRNLPVDVGAISMIRDYMDNIWLGSMDGLYFYDYSDLRKIREDIFDRQIGALEITSGNQLMIGTINGLGLIDLEDFYEKGAENVRLFDQENGFPGIECRNNAIFHDGTHHFWICTSDKVVKFTPEQLETDTIPPELYMTSTYSLDQKPSTIQLIKMNDDQIAKIETHDRNLRIEFQALEFKAPKRVRYRFLLEGRDKDWSDPFKSRNVDLLDLEPGDYTLKIKASNGDGVWMDEPESIQLSIVPFFWETNIFLFFSVVFLVGLVFMGGRMVSRSRIRKIRLEEERRKEMARFQFQAISNLIDPHFTFNILNSIGSVIFKKEHKNAYDYFTRFAGLIRSALEYSEVFVRPLEQEIQFVSDFMELEKLRYKEKLEYKIRVDPKVNSRMMIPKMIIQTFVENAIRHGIAGKAGPGNVEVNIRDEGDSIYIAVRDDGVGRREAGKTQKESTGKGIRLLNEYIGLFNQFNENKITFFIEDMDAKHDARGTIVHIQIPKNYHYETAR